jgi:hypothetical protein
MRACVHRVTKKGKVLGVIEISPTDGMVLGKTGNHTAAAFGLFACGLARTVCVCVCVCAHQALVAPGSSTRDSRYDAHGSTLTPGTVLCVHAPSALRSALQALALATPAPDSSARGSDTSWHKPVP